jgi:hypothetical protein
MTCNTLEQYYTTRENPKCTKAKGKTYDNCKRYRDNKVILKTAKKWKEIETHSHHEYSIHESIPPPSETTHTIALKK